MPISRGKLLLLKRLQEAAISLRRVASADCSRLWFWANDAEARRSSLNTSPITWREHVAWFQALKGDEECVLIVELGQTSPEAIGVARCRRIEDPRGGAAGEISLNLDPAVRGFGLGVRALAQSCPLFLHHFGIRRLLARIHGENARSARVFRRVGFAPQRISRSSNLQWELWGFEGPR